MLNLKELDIEKIVSTFHTTGQDHLVHYNLEHILYKVKLRVIK